MSKVAIAEAAMAATSVIGLAKYFAKKTAATKVTQVVTAGASRLIWGPPKDPADEPKPIVEEGPDFEHGQTQRVFGVYIGFAPMHFAIREKLNEEGVLIAELWDEDKSTQVV